MAEKKAVKKMQARKRAKNYFKNKRWVLIVWDDGTGETQLIVRDVAPKDLAQLRRFHRCYIGDACNSEELETEMQVYFFDEDNNFRFAPYNRNEAIADGIFHLVILTGCLP